MKPPPPAPSSEQPPQYNRVARLTCQGHTLLYNTPNRLCMVRARTLMTKEPATIEWLDGIPPEAVLVDVGANVGMYTIYAAVVRQARVFAFEPEAQNYAMLCRNILINKVGLRAVAWCTAISDEEKFDRIYLSKIAFGMSGHSFGEQRDSFLREASFRFVQGSFSTTLDRLVELGAIEPPAYVKVDVDGFEHKVVRGAAKTLADARLRSLLVEINADIPEHRWIVEHLTSLGFDLDPAQVERARRVEGPNKGLAEHVFFRRAPSPAEHAP